MSITERLYYNDSHLTKFDARVVAKSLDAEGRALLTLDRTAFYPAGGGQPSDTGIIESARVVECVDEGDAGGVLHVVEGEAPDVGARVSGLVDWPRRLDHMQQHTGQHILSQAFVELFGAQTRAFRMLVEASEIDVELSEPSDERVERAIERANEIIWDDRALRVHHVSAAEAATMPLRRDSAREGELRVIEIEGFDMSPCGGTHAHRTGEVGIIAARSWERAKGMTRVVFVAGSRVLSDYRRANATARGVAALLSTGRDEAVAGVAHLLEENKQLGRRLRSLEELAARIEAEELLAETEPRAGDDQARIVTRAFGERDAEALKRLALALVSHSRVVALLGAHDGASSVRLVFARSSDMTGDMNALMREACAMIDGRGGGRPELAQGGGRDTGKLAGTIEAAARKLSA